MQEKMGHAQAILAGVITNDWAALDRESRALALAVRDPAWIAALTGPDYYARATHSRAPCRISSRHRPSVIWIPPPTPKSS